MYLVFIFVLDGFAHTSSIKFQIPFLSVPDSERDCSPTLKTCQNKGSLSKYIGMGKFTLYAC